MIHSHKKALITLIRPSVLELSSNLSSFGAIPPIGLAYIAATLRDAGYPVKVIDGPGCAIQRVLKIESPVGTLLLNGLTVDEIIERLDVTTQVIGITHMFLHEWPMIREIAQKAKTKIGNVKIVLGGENATAFWDRIFQESAAVDYCVLGEGEFSMLELVNQLTDESIPKEIPGILSRTSASRDLLGRPASSLTSPRTRDLSKIPWPAWEYFNIEAYLGNMDHHGVHRGRSMPILATRGCPYQCTFCSSPGMWTTRYETRSPSDVVKEMRYYVEKYRPDNFNICDLTAIVRREWILEFCSLLKKEHFKITWQLPTGTRSEALDEEVLQNLYDTGCRNICYAPESGSKRMLELVKKRTNPEKVLKSLRASCRIGLVTRLNIIIGHPEERRPDLWQTLWFLIRCALIGCQDASVMIFAPYPGSEDARKLQREGKLVITENYYYHSLARSGRSSKTFNPIMSTVELVTMQFFILIIFYSLAYLTRPWRIFRAVTSFVTGNEETQFDQLIRTKLERMRRSETI